MATVVRPQRRAAAREHSSLSNYEDVRITHSSYDFAVDLAAKRIEGYAVLTLERRTPDATVLVLDTRALDIVAVHALPDTATARTVVEGDAEAAAAAEYSLSEPHAALGVALTVTLPPGGNDGGGKVGVRFRVGEASTAVQFLAPQQTAGGAAPFLFTQCQAIHARALVPCQDTPSVKMTYDARVTVPAPLTAVMSARSAEGEPPPPHSPLAAPGAPLATFAFSQPTPIPSYLLALAVGELTSRRLGPISRVWAEPAVVDAAQHEFSEVLEFLAAGEALAGPYRWGQYDLLLLPQSFPYGGMENPCLTFVTPTLLTGDRSATNVVAHEIAHSWTGNLVTNATWQHFWLNEGWTVFMERKILGRVSGPEAEQFHALQGFLALERTVKELGPTHAYTALVPRLEDGADPDDAFSRIPYEKGFYFLYHLQTLCGGPEAFEPFMRAYIDRFALGTVTTDEFKAFLLEYFPDVQALQELDWDTWLYAPGMPPAVNTYHAPQAAAADALAAAWHTADPLRTGAAAPADARADAVRAWSPDLKAAFLARLSQFAGLSALHAGTTRKMDELYGLDAIRHPEVRCKWLLLCIGAEDRAALDDALLFAREQGRMKFVRPLYAALHRSKMGRDAAVEQFTRLRGTYHPICAKMVAQDLKLPAS